VFVEIFNLVCHTRRLTTKKKQVETPPIKEKRLRFNLRRSRNKSKGSSSDSTPPDVIRTRSPPRRPSTPKPTGQGQTSKNAVTSAHSNTTRYPAVRTSDIAREIASIGVGKSTAPLLSSIPGDFPFRVRAVK